ncbi:60S ribosomal export protein NMD3 [bacterium]|nr:60S ribosomal export protein NMD3 [bacterium]
MRCILCGREIKRGNLCRECLLKRYELFTVKKFEVTLCNCGSVLVHGRWKRFPSTEKALAYLVHSDIKSEHELSKLDIETEVLSDRVAFRVTAHGRIKGYKKVETKRFEAKLKRKLCTQCAKKAGGYYEAVLQVRAGKKDEVMKVVEKYSEAISSVKEVREGIDVLFVKKSAAKKVARVLRAMGYEIKTSCKLVGAKHGKKLYREYYSVKEKTKSKAPLPSFFPVRCGARTTAWLTATAPVLCSPYRSPDTRARIHRVLTNSRRVR